MVFVVILMVFFSGFRFSLSLVGFETSLFGFYQVVQTCAVIII